MGTEYDDYEDAELGPARPWWVVVGLWGLPNRASAWVFFWLCALLAAGGLVGAVFFWPLGFGVLFLVAAWWYYMCMLGRSVRPVAVKAEDRCEISGSTVARAAGQVIERSSDRGFCLARIRSSGVVWEGVGGGAGGLS